MRVRVWILPDSNPNWDLPSDLVLELDLDLNSDTLTLSLVLDLDPNVVLEFDVTMTQTPDTDTLTLILTFDLTFTLTVTLTDPDPNSEQDFFSASHPDSNPYPDSDLDRVCDPECDPDCNLNDLGANVRDCQISSKSVERLRTYGVLTVFKMMAVCHLGLLKFTILMVWTVKRSHLHHSANFR